MKKISGIIYLLLGILLVLNACNCEKGSGEVKTEKRKVDNFTKIEINGIAKVYIKQGNFEDIEIIADDNLLPLINTEVRNDRLKISMDKCVKYVSKLEVYISLPKLESLEVNGACELKSKNKFISEELEIESNGAGEIDLKIDVDKMRSKISGSADVKLEGSAIEHKIDLSGAGELDAYKFTTKEADIEVSGAGTCKVFVTEELNAEVSGTGFIRYKGEPKNVDTKVSGAGSIKAK